MTIEEKIGQLAQYNCDVFIQSDAQITGPQATWGLTDEDVARVGSVLNFSSVEEMKQIQDAHLANDPHKIPMVFMMDVIHGFRTIYPIPLALGCSFDPELAERCSRMAAKEAAASGVQVTFTPMVDYTRDARWGRVMESCGEEPLLTSAIAQGQIRGFQGDDLADPENLATCVKHFAGYGGAEAGRDYNIVEKSQRELREYYLPAYKACLDAGSPMVMPSFNSLNGIPSIANPWLMNQVLKEEWGFDGVVISDYSAISELLTHGVAADMKDAARMAFDCGCDIEMCSSGYIHHLKELVEEGAIPDEKLDEAVLRVLRLKERLGLFEDPYHGADAEKAEKLFLSPEHRAIVKQAAAESAVLLKNDGLLPFPADTANVAIIGPFADEKAIQGFWSCNGRDEECTTVYEGVSALLKNANITVEKGCGSQWNDLDGSGIDAAVRAAKAADAVILCLGEPQNYTGEGNCRTDLGLPGLQLELAKKVIAANPNTAVVLFNGRPLVLTELDAIAPAILEMWFPGTEGGSAAAELLFGLADPCGKLSMSFPRNVGQCPIYYNRPNTGRPHWTSVAEHFPFCSDYIDSPTLPLYSFGHGLSYTDFTYGPLELSGNSLTWDGELQVRVNVRNTGSRRGKETVQLYMQDLVASVVRPVQQLIAFEKIDLAPGQAQTVSFTVTEPMLRFWNFENQHVSEKGRFRLMVGHADHFTAEAQFDLI